MKSLLLKLLKSLNKKSGMQKLINLKMLCPKIAELHILLNINVLQLSELNQQLIKKHITVNNLDINYK